MTRTLSIALAAVLTLALAGPAHGAEVTIDEATANTTFVAAPGEENRLEVRFVTIDDDANTGTPEVPVIEYHDFAAPVTTPPSAYCRQSDDSTVHCSRADELDALATIDLGDGNDTLREGTPGRDAILGGPGNDLLVGRGGNDLVDGGAGDDTLEDPEWSGCSGEGGSLGADTIIGGPGTDELMQICRKAFVTVTLDGQANDGSDGEGDNVAGDIEVIEGPGYETGMRFVGNDLPNTVHGGGLSSVLIGGGGDDRLYGSVQDDELEGGPGNDIVEGWGGGDTVDGGAGTDDLSGEGGSTITDGTGGADTILARDGELDTVACGSGADQAVVDQRDVISESGRDSCESIDRAAGGGGPDANAEVALGAKSAKVRKGSFRVPLVCVSAVDCEGRVSVKKKPRLVGAARFSIGGGKAKKVKVRLTRAGRKLMRRGKTLKVVVAVKLAGQGPGTAGFKLRR